MFTKEQQELLALFLTTNDTSYLCQMAKVMRDEAERLAKRADALEQMAKNYEIAHKK